MRAGRWFASLALVVLTLTSVLRFTAPAIGAATPAPAENVWLELYRLELKALRDYDLHITTGAVRQRANRAFVLSRVDAFSGEHVGCRMAAQTLSYMIQGYVDSSRRLETSHDWTHFASRYLDQRSRCLEQLDLNERDYPLPVWFAP